MSKNVVCEKLKDGWIRECKKRKNEKRWDVCLYPPNSKTILRSVFDLVRYITMHNLVIDPYVINMDYPKEMTGHSETQVTKMTLKLIQIINRLRENTHEPIAISDKINVVPVASSFLPPYKLKNEKKRRKKRKVEIFQNNDKNKEKNDENWTLIYNDLRVEKERNDNENNDNYHEDEEKDKDGKCNKNDEIQEEEKGKDGKCNKNDEIQEEEKEKDGKWNKNDENQGKDGKWNKNDEIQDEKKYECTSSRRKNGIFVTLKKKECETNIIENLPGGWIRSTKRRASGLKWDVFLTPPFSFKGQNAKIRSVNDLVRFIAATRCSIDPYIINTDYSRKITGLQDSFVTNTTRKLIAALNALGEETHPKIQFPSPNRVVKNVKILPEYIVRKIPIIPKILKRKSLDTYERSNKVIEKLQGGWIRESVQNISSTETWNIILNPPKPWSSHKLYSVWDLILCISETKLRIDPYVINFDSPSDVRQLSSYSSSSRFVTISTYNLIRHLNCLHICESFLPPISNVIQTLGPFVYKENEVERERQWTKKNWELQTENNIENVYSCTQQRASNIEVLDIRNAESCPIITSIMSLEPNSSSKTIMESTSECDENEGGNETDDSIDVTDITRIIHEKNNFILEIHSY